MRKIINIALALALMAGLCVTVSAAGGSFSDVTSDKWYYQYVKKATDLGLVNGVGGGKYAPDKQVTYAEFATMLVNISWADEVKVTQTHPSDPWWMAQAIVADNHNLFFGTPLYDEYEWYTYANVAVTRSDMAIMTHNYMLACGRSDIQASAVTATIKSINDIGGEDALHTKAIAYCYSNGLLNGTGGGNFSPDDNMTRAQAATVLCSVYDAVVSTTDPDASKDAQVTVSATGKYPTAIVSLVVATSDTIEFAFCIEPEEDYPGVIMPDDNYASIYGGGTVEFEPITFTQDAAPGEYKFTIYQLEGMEDYRYDDRTWTLTINLASNGGIARPEGAVGGHYDTSKYTALADVNSDGWLTADEVQAVLDRLKQEYPSGTAWGETTRYPGLYEYSGGAVSSGLGAGSACDGYAKMVSDQIFGNLPKYVVSIEEIRMGDYMRNGPDNHASIALCSVGEGKLGEFTSPTMYNTTDGNVSGTVGWGRARYAEDWPADTKNTYIWSRYPAEDGSWTALEMSVESVSYSRNSEAMPETSSEHAHFVNTCLEGMQWDRSTVAKANEIMAGMTLEEKVGQLILFHYPGNGSGTVAQATNIINNYHVGGFLVFANMFNGSNPTAVAKKVADTQAASDIPLLFTVDEEGGTVNRISLYTAFRSEKFKSPSALKAAGGLSAVIADCVEKAALLKSLGMNVNHAPVADLATESGSFMYNRAWRGDGVETAKYVEAVVRATEAGGVGTTMKHFPGYGGTSGDTHAGFNINSLPLENFLYDDTLPFQAGMTAGGHSVMVTHNTIEAFDSVNPSSLAPAVYDFLRSEMHFDGVAMTDDLAMGAITAHVGANQASLRALQAGADMAMTPSTGDVDVVLAAARSGKAGGYPC